MFVHILLPVSDTDNISLHDHLIDEILFQGDDILLIFFNGFDVIKTHPLNGTGKSKHTSKAQIILKCAKFATGIAHSPQNEKREVDISNFTSQFSGFEVLDHKVENKKLILSGNLHANPVSLFEYTELSFYYADIIFCWNDYTTDAWFECYPSHKQ